MEKNGEQKNGPLLFDPAEDRVAPVDPLGFGAVSATEEGRRAREQRREARSSRSVSGSCLGRSLPLSLSRLLRPVAVKSSAPEEEDLA
jgi:hypothetical protein